MILTDKKIRDLCEKNNMISPFEEEALQSESYNLSIGDKVYVVNQNIRELDLDDKLSLDNLYKEVKITDKGFLINPKEYVLVSLNEALNIPEKINAHIRPRTRFIRAGLYVSVQHCNSTYSGNLKIGIFNFLNIPNITNIVPALTPGTIFAIPIIIPIIICCINFIFTSYLCIIFLSF